MVTEGKVRLKVLQSHVRKILDVKWDLGLFDNPLVSESLDPVALVDAHRNLTLEMARKSIVLLKNSNGTLPLGQSAHEATRIALVGPFADTLNFGDYSGQWGQQPVANASTIRQGILEYTKEHPNIEVLTSWGANSWEYNTQNAVPSYLLSSNGTHGGLSATYFANPNFTDPRVWGLENPFMDWGLCPPPRLPSANFSATWGGELHFPVDHDVDGWIGVAVGPNTTVRLYMDGALVTSKDYSSRGNILGNIMPFPFTQANGTAPPAGAAPFTFRRGATYRIRIEYQAYSTYQKIENQSSLNSQVLLFWNLVSRHNDAVDLAVSLANRADVVVLAVGAGWNSDGENGDRAHLGLAPGQDALAEAVYTLGKPVVLVLQGGRPWAIPEHYQRSAAVLNAFFAGQSAGQAIADVLFGVFNPGGRMPITVPRHVGQIPVYYNYKPSAQSARYVDIDSTPYYPFGYGLSYTTFAVSSFRASASARPGDHHLDVTAKGTFTHGSLINFSTQVKNTGSRAGSYVVQVYLLGRISTITQPVKQLVAFRRVYLEGGETAAVLLELDVDRYLQILNRKYEWELEKGNYTFAVLEHSGANADTGMRITMQCI